MAKPRRGLSKFPADAVGRCLRTVELALSNKNRDEAMVAIDRLFAEFSSVRVTNESCVDALDLSEYVLRELHRARIKTIGCLTKLSAQEVREIKNIGRGSFEQIDTALDDMGLSLRRSHAKQI